MTHGQRRVVEAEGVRLVGFDARRYPVVEETYDGVTEQWAVAPTGDPCDTIRQPVTERTDA